jgi:hypothetical protein
MRDRLLALLPICTLRLVCARPDPPPSPPRPLRLTFPASLSTCSGTVATFSISGGAPPYELWTVSGISSGGGEGYASLRSDALYIDHVILVSGIDAFSAADVQAGWPASGVVAPSFTSFAVFDSTGRGWVDGDGDGARAWRIENIVCAPRPPLPAPLPSMPSGEIAPNADSTTLVPTIPVWPSTVETNSPRCARGPT